MDDEILIKPLSLWPEYSMGDLPILPENGCRNEPQNEPQFLQFSPATIPQNPLNGKTPEPLQFRGFRGNSALGELRRAVGGLEAVLLTPYPEKLPIFKRFEDLFLKCTPMCTPKNRYFGLLANAWLTFEIRSFGWL